MLSVFPKPKIMNIMNKNLELSCTIDMQINSGIAESFRQVGYNFEDEIKKNFLVCQNNSRVLIKIKNSNLIAEQGYRLTISEDGIQIVCSSSIGCYYGILTLTQLVSQSKEHLPFLFIEDAPTILLRGVMLDIGRDKIPKISTLYHIIDLLSAIRINHLQFYMEGFCFDYEKYRSLFSDDTPITSQEFNQLADYARSRFIDLVPNQNCLGHMDQWLALPQFKSLAECPDGFLHQNLYKRPPMTLDVYDPKAAELAEYFLDQLLPNFHSEFVNVNLDEPFELGKGKNKNIADQFGSGKLYLDFIKKIHVMSSERSKKMMMWGDVIFSHPELISDLPEDITILDWIYEGDASFESHCQMIVKTGRDFCLCPGTSSWCSFTGRTDNMIKNIANAVYCADKYGAKGVIITDWGDLGHWQYLPTSYLSFAYAASYTWSGEQECTALVEDYCNRAIFMDEEQKASRIMHDLGNYYHLEHATLYNTTLSFAMMSSKYRFNTSEEFSEMVSRLLKISQNIAVENDIPFDQPSISVDYEGLKTYLDDLEQRLEVLKMNCEDGKFIKAEMKNSIRMIRHGSHLYRVMTENRNSKEKLAVEMQKLFNDMCIIIEDHYRLWSARNRNGGFSRSIRQMQFLLDFYSKQQ